MRTNRGRRLALSTAALGLLVLLGAGVASKILGTMGPEAREAIPTLVAALKDKRVDVASLACSALGSIGPSAVPALLEGLKYEDRTGRHLAAVALARVSPKPNANEVVPVLIEAALADDNEHVRYVATEALGALGAEAKEAIAASANAFAKKHAEEALEKSRRSAAQTMPLAR